MSGRYASALTRGVALGLLLGAALASAQTRTRTHSGTSTTRPETSTPPPATTRPEVSPPVAPLPPPEPVAPVAPPPPPDLNARAPTTKVEVSAPATPPEPVFAGPDSPYHADFGWDAQWAMLFSLNNVLAAGTILASPVEGSLGAQYFLSHKTAIRMGLGFTRNSNPVTVTKVVNTAGSQTVATYTLTPGGGDNYNLVARADYLYRLLDKPLSPYVGAGVFGGWSLNKLRYNDSQTVVDQVTAIDNNTSAFSIGLNGTVGAEWRFHPSFAVYADYTLTVNVLTNTHLSNRTTVQNSVGGVTSTNQSVTTSDVNRWLAVNTGLSQGAALGLELFF